MTSKEIKKYNLIHAIIGAHYADPNVVSRLLELASIDYQCAFEIWEYKLTVNSDLLIDMDVCENIVDKAFDALFKFSETKFRQLFTESLPINKLVYSQCASSCTDTNLEYITNLILTNKLDAAEEILRCVRANDCKNMDFGMRMKAIIDTVFDTYCTKNNVKKCELNKKQTILLVEYISKIKGPNKKLLTQRIKEL